MAKKVRITTEAYQNIGLHGMKYAYNNIFGFLIGSEKNQTVDVLSIYPVSHTIPLAPVLELAAEMAERSQSNSNNKIIGVYYGKEVEPSDSAAPSTPLYVEKIAQTIRTLAGGDCVILHLKASSLSDEKRNFLEVMTSGYKLETVETINTMNAAVTGAIQKNQHLLFHDFEDFINSSGKHQVTVQI